MDPVLVSVLAAALVGAAGVLGVLLVARWSVVAAAVAAPFVVVMTLSVGILASVRTMALRTSDSTTIVLVLAATVPVALAAGLVLGRRLHERDLEVGRAEAARERDREVEAHRRELVGWIAHDLRTPLAGMRAVTEALQDDVVDDRAASLDLLRDGTVRLSGMVDDLLALSRLQVPGRSTHREQVSVSDLASDVVAQLTPVAARAGVTLSGSAESSVESPADPREVTRALSNLVDNAVRHTPSGGRVVVSVRSTTDTNVVSVQDACGGIPPDHLPHLFTAGWRGSQARGHGDGAGAGLGLAIVREVAHAHGGTVSVRNADRGCVFELELPHRHDPEVGSVRRARG